MGGGDAQGIGTSRRARGWEARGTRATEARGRRGTRPEPTGRHAARRISPAPPRPAGSLCIAPHNAKLISACGTQRTGGASKLDSGHESAGKTRIHEAEKQNGD